MYAQSSKFPDYGSLSGSDETRPRTNSNLSTCNQLIDHITYNIPIIQNYVTSLERTYRDIGTQADSDLLRDEIHEYRTKAKELVGTTTRFVRDLKTAVQREDRELRLRTARLESEFRACIERFDVFQKKLVPKMQQCPVPAKSKTENIWGIGEESQDNLIDGDKLQQQVQLQTELEHEQGLLLEREAKIRQIEADILDVNQVFKLLGAKIHEQGDTINTIEANITNVADNVELGREELSKASGYQKSYRTKMCWLILVILLVCVGIVIWVIVANR